MHNLRFLFVTVKPDATCKFVVELTPLKITTKQSQKVMFETQFMRLNRLQSRFSLSPMSVLYAVQIPKFVFPFFNLLYGDSELSPVYIEVQLHVLCESFCTIKL